MGNAKGTHSAGAAGPNDSPLVSICIPAYARPQELERAIMSVLEQDVTDVEVVVGDDSGDLESVVQRINDRRVVYVRNEPRLGMAENWNAMLDRARGRYLGLLMDDDYYLPGFLSEVMQAFSAAPDVGLVCTDHMFSDGARMWARICTLPEGRHDASAFTMLSSRAAAVSATVIRRDIWQAIRPLPDLLTADVVMHLRVAIAGHPMFYIDRPLMVYSVHPGQQSITSPRFREDQVAALQLFSFDEPQAEKLRHRRLTQARISVAAAQLRADQIDEARATLRSAREFGLGSLGARGLMLTLLARYPALARPLLRLKQRPARAENSE
jgi:glycosyltransferase involved in cell wall biosynthesis